MKTAKLGVHQFVFTDVWSEPNARAACRAAADIGFELFEVALPLDPGDLDAAMTRKTVVTEAGLGLRLSLVLQPATDIASATPEIAAAGEAAVIRSLELAADLDVPNVSGVTYSACTLYSAPPTEAQMQNLAAALSRIDARAGDLGVRLGLEPVNRYETSVFNTLDQAGDMIRGIGAKNLFLHMDTCHMNIDEFDIPAAIARNADLLGYTHLGESHHGVFGTGTFDFRGYFRALASAGYTGDFTVETFSPAVLTPQTAGAIRLWRRTWESSEAAATSCLAFMRTEIAAAVQATQAI
ncbi:sugar phosphate isomerase/epimerase [Tropicimonas sp. IMCC34043]|uniref:sugar phosphate isomerase/epimerase family protein n=1 Tax=Tropicimonas sp. IMCC34043 TaxID=2248760 RepID=UPI000E251952|nr:sugar phosphate isomerase/epimerase family protein [Tropicimonas sp. IMCC34043]